MLRACEANVQTSEIVTESSCQSQPAYERYRYLVALAGWLSFVAVLMNRMPSGLAVRAAEGFDDYTENLLYALSGQLSSSVTLGVLCGKPEAVAIVYFGVMSIFQPSTDLASEEGLPIYLIAATAMVFTTIAFPACVLLLAVFIYFTAPLFIRVGTLIGTVAMAPVTLLRMLRRNPVNAALAVLMLAYIVVLMQPKVVAYAESWGEYHDSYQREIRRLQKMLEREQQHSDHFEQEAKHAYMNERGEYVVWTHHANGKWSYSQQFATKDAERHELFSEEIKSHFRTLGLEYDSKPETIRKQYRALSKQHHPDKGGDVTMFRRIANAYEAVVAEFKLDYHE